MNATISKITMEYQNVQFRKIKKEFFRVTEKITNLSLKDEFIQMQDKLSKVFYAIDAELEAVKNTNQLLIG